MSATNSTPQLLRALNTGPVTVSWRHRDTARFVWDVDYAELRALHGRIMRRFSTGPSQLADVSRQVASLAEPGTALVARMDDDHRVALIRPFVLGDLDGPDPVLLAFGDEVRLPILVGDIGRARRLSRLLREHGSQEAPLQIYLGEREVREPPPRPQSRPIGSPIGVARTKLEDQLDQILFARSSVDGGKAQSRSDRSNSWRMKSTQPWESPADGCA